MKRFLLLLFVSALTFACKTPKNASSAVTKIVHGTSYGHCVGYCLNDEIYEGSSIRFVRTSRDESQYPQKNETAALTQADFQNILDSFSFRKFKSLPERIGCPDCADGGMEYLEITSGGETKRVEFEAGTEPDGMAGLLEILRKNREGRFAE